MQVQNVTVTHGPSDKKHAPFWPLGTTETFTVAFTVLKLHGDIDWSWWWVTVPVWGVIAFKTIVGVVAYVATKQGEE